MFKSTWRHLEEFFFIQRDHISDDDKSQCCIQDWLSWLWHQLCWWNREGTQDPCVRTPQGSGESGLLRFRSSSACMGTWPSHRLDDHVCLRSWISLPVKTILSSLNRDRGTLPDIYDYNCPLPLRAAAIWLWTHIITLYVCCFWSKILHYTDEGYCKVAKTSVLK